MRENEPPYQYGTNQNVTIAATSAATSNATDADTRILRLVSTTDTYINIGSAPTATSADPILPAGFVEYVVVHGATKVAGLQVTAGGVLSVTEMSK